MDPLYVVENNAASPATYYVVFEAADIGNTGFYVPYVLSFGTDADGDSYYTLDYYLGHDCNDADLNIYPFEPGGTCGQP
jgi:hypothetical protein